MIHGSTQYKLKGIGEWNVPLVDCMAHDHRTDDQLSTTHNLNNNSSLLHWKFIPSVALLTSFSHAHLDTFIYSSIASRLCQMWTQKSKIKWISIHAECFWFTWIIETKTKFTSPQLGYHCYYKIAERKCFSGCGPVKINSSSIYRSRSATVRCSFVSDYWNQQWLTSDD